MADLALDIHGLSHHFGRASESREYNPGLGLSYSQMIRDGVITVSAGRYLNSIDRRSNYASVSWGYPLMHGVTGGVLGGFVSGYQSEPVPVVAPYLRVGPLSFTLIPPSHLNHLTLTMSISIYLTTMENLPLLCGPTNKPLGS